MISLLDSIILPLKQCPGVLLPHSLPLPPIKYCNAIRLGCSLVAKVTSLLVRGLPPYLSLLLLHLCSNTFNIGLLREKKIPLTNYLAWNPYIRRSVRCWVISWHTIWCLQRKSTWQGQMQQERKKDSVQYNSNIADLNIKQEYMYPVNKEVLWLNWLLITLSAIQGASILVTMVCGGKKIGD